MVRPRSPAENKRPAASSNSQLQASSRDGAPFQAASSTKATLGHLNDWVVLRRLGLCVILAARALLTGVIQTLSCQREEQQSRSTRRHVMSTTTATPETSSSCNRQASQWGFRFSTYLWEAQGQIQHVATETCSRTIPCKGLLWSTLFTIFLEAECQCQLHGMELRMQFRIASSELSC